MSIYFISFIFACIIPFIGKHFDNKTNKFIWFFLLFFLTFFYSAKWHVGGDYAVYYDYVLLSKQRSLYELLFIAEPAYMFITWINTRLGTELVGVNFLSALFFFIGFNRLLKENKYPLLSLIIILPILFFVVLNGYIRQSFAIGLSFIALSYLVEGKKSIFIFLIIVGSLFHRTCIVNLILLFYDPRIFEIIKSIFVLSIFLFFYVILCYFFYGHFDLELFFQISKYRDDIVNYVYSGIWESHGAVPRCLLNIIPAILYILFYKKFSNYKDNQVYLFISIISIILFALIPISSVMADRLMFYFYPIQFIFYTRFISAVNDKSHKNYLYFVVITFYFFILIYYFFFSINANQLYPYKMYFFEDRPSNCALFDC